MEIESPIRIMHLEDSPEDAVLVHGVLQAEGIQFQARVVETESAFREVLARGDVDLILSDHSMPGFDGLRALEVARERFPDLPFILVSGTIGEDAAIESLRSGATDYVLKARLSRLVPAVRRALREADERRRRRQAVEALHDKQQFLMAMLESLDTGILACDAGGNLTLMNRALRDIHGGPLEPIPPEAWARHFGLYAPGGKRLLETDELPLLRCLRGEVVRNLEVQIVPRHGPARTVVVGGRPVLDAHGQRVGAVLAIHDVTEHRHLEAQFLAAQRMEAIGQLAGGLAHDFNNFLSVILGYGELAMADAGATPSLREKILQIRKAADRAASLARQLLTFSRKQPGAPQVLDLRAILAEIEKLLRRVIGEDVELILRMGDEACFVSADPGQIEQIVMNLAVNSRDAMPRGGRLTIETGEVFVDSEFVASHPGSRPGAHVLLSTSDTGAGMDDEVRSRIFEPFFTTKEEGKGTGLGLSTVYGIVKQRDGYISVDSRPGAGTVFRIYLPRAERPADAAQAAKAAASPGGTETILVVEDEEEVRELVRQGLAAYGYRVLVAEREEEAEALARRHAGPIALLLTDVVLPGTQGREIAQRLRQRHPGLKVVFMSGYPADVLVRHGLLESTDGLLAKPFALTSLARRIRDVLGPATGGTGLHQAVGRA